MNESNADNPIIDPTTSTTPAAANGEAVSPTMPYAKPGHGRNQYTWSKGNGGPGSPKGTANALKTGSRSSQTLRQAILTGKLPDKFKHHERPIAVIRRVAEQLVLDAYGECGFTHTALIGTLQWNQLRIRLETEWLAQNLDKIEPTDRLRYMDSISRAFAARDKAIEQLKISGRKIRDAGASAWEQRQKQIMEAQVFPSQPTDKPLTVPTVDAGQGEGNAQ